MDLLQEVSVNNLDEVMDKAMDKATDVNVVDDNGETALMIAVRKGLTKIVKKLLIISNIDLNIVSNSNETAFSIAINNGLLNILNMLIDDERLDVNIKTSNGYYLHQLILKNNLPIIKKILKIDNIDMSITDSNGNNSLHLAAINNRTRLILRYLLGDSRTSINQENDKIQTPLDVAKESDKGSMNLLEIKKYLKEKFGQ